MKTNKILFAIVVLILIGAGVFYSYQKFVVDKAAQNLATNKATAGVISSATFYCAGNKNIQAVFFADKVELVLSDGRKMLLPQALSASGARYANNDESFVFWNKGDTAFVNEGDKTTFEECAINIGNVKEDVKTATTTAQIANPASVNCTKSGGNLVIQKRGDGGEYGLCYFEDNRACEEWALMRGDCPIGGVKTTGYDSIDQKYCAWSGGKTLAETNSVCTFKDGSKCPTEAFYNGTCLMSQSAELKK